MSSIFNQQSTSHQNHYWNHSQNHTAKRNKKQKTEKKKMKKKTAEILALCKIVDQEVISIERQTQIASLWAGMASFWASTVSQKNFSKMK